MQRFLAGFLCLLIMLQTFSRELQVLDYQAHKEQVTRLFCVNKDKPQLHCNGKCHLAKELRKASEAESKAPAAGFAKLKYEVLPPVFFRLPQPQPAVRPAPARFAPVVASCYAFSPAQGIFHPPAERA